MQSKILNPQSKIELVYPLRHFPTHTEPFPTIYYLRDPQLIHAMSELERHHHIARLQEQLRGDPALMKKYHADHAAYRDARWDMLTPEDRAVVENSPSLSRSFRGGIAGIADFDFVKCLHAQYAHHLAMHDRGGTTVGRLIDELLINP